MAMTPHPPTVEVNFETDHERNGFRRVPEIRAKRAFFVGASRRHQRKLGLPALTKAPERHAVEVAGEEQGRPPSGKRAESLTSQQCKNGLLPTPIATDPNAPTRANWIQVVTDGNAGARGINAFDDAYVTAAGPEHVPWESYHEICSKDDGNYVLIDYPYPGDRKYKAGANISSREQMWRVLAAGVFAREKTVISRVWRRLANVIVDSDGTTKLCRSMLSLDVDDPRIGFTPDVLRRMVGLEPEDDAQLACSKLASTVGFLTLRARKPGLAFIMLRAILHNGEFSAHADSPWQMHARSCEMAHVLSGILVCAMDAFFAGSWFMHDGVSPTKYTCSKAAGEERLSRYRRWSGLCDLAMELIADHGMPDTVVVSTLTHNKGIHKYDRLTHGLALVMPSGTQPCGVRTFVVSTLRIAFEASHVHEWPFKAMMSLPANNWSVKTLDHLFRHIIIMPAPAPAFDNENFYGDSYEEEMSEKRRRDCLVQVYGKMVELSTTADTYHEREAAAGAVLKLWTDLPGFGLAHAGAWQAPDTLGLFHSDAAITVCNRPRTSRFEALVQAMLLKMPVPSEDMLVKDDDEVAAAGAGPWRPTAVTICTAVAGMAAALLQYYPKIALEDLDTTVEYKPPPAHALPVYVRALVDITQQHPAFLRAARPLACLDNMVVARLAVLLTYAQRTDCSLTRAFLGLADAIGHHVHAVMGWDQSPLATWESAALTLPKTLLADFFEPTPAEDSVDAAKHAAWYVRHVCDLGKVVFAHFARCGTDGLGAGLADIMSYWLENALYDEDAPGIGRQYLLYCFDKHENHAVVDDVSAQIERMWSPDTLTSASSLLSQFVEHRAAHRECANCRSAKLQACYDDETRALFTQMLKADEWSARELQWALCVAGATGDPICARVLMLPLERHPRGISIADAPEWMLHRAVWMEGDNETTVCGVFFDNDHDGATAFLESVAADVYGLDGEGYATVQASTAYSSNKRQRV